MSGGTRFDSGRVHLHLPVRMVLRIMAKSKVTIVCDECGASTEKLAAEINRQIKRGASRFFCTVQCAGKRVNDKKRSESIVKQCLRCGKNFASTTKSKASSHCSRGCASANSVTQYRLDKVRETIKIHGTALNGVTPALMKKREGWKYVDVQDVLTRKNERHEIEAQIDGEGPIFDLLLPDKLLVIEFDGPYHTGAKQLGADAANERYATERGWTVVRIKTPAMAVFDASEVIRLLDKQA